MGRRILHTGALGSASVLKVVTNYLCSVHLVALGEAMMVAKNAGMDLNFLHAFDPFIGGTSGSFGGTADSSLRMVFLASDKPVIEVFDTFYFGRVTQIPIRDPIIGPLRVAVIPGTQEQVLVGVTARGVVMVRFPQIPNTFPAPGRP